MPKPANYYLYAVDPRADFLVNRPKGKPPSELFAPEFQSNDMWLDKMTGWGEDQPVTMGTMEFEVDSSLRSEIVLPLNTIGVAEIEWGDGTPNTALTVGSARWSHTYAVPGIYRIKVHGDVQGLVSVAGELTTDLVALTKVRHWDMGKVANIYFRGAANLIQVPNELPPGVTSLASVFRAATLFNWDISGWDVSNVTDMTVMLYQASSFNQPIGTWDVSNVTDMSFMLRQAASFNQDIGNWDVSNVTTMDVMFWQATSFNQDLSGWCVSLIPTLPTNFATGSALDPANYPVWGTCPP
jgi:surface protein